MRDVRCIIDDQHRTLSFSIIQTQSGLVWVLSAASGDEMQLMTPYMHILSSFMLILFSCVRLVEDFALKTAV